MELSKNYQPEGVEDKWSKHWKSKRYFNSTPDERKPFTVVIPPPNVTGVLHMGHTLNETVQDILVRKARMSGFNACWVPGSDHASIATESKVVQMLEKEKGIKKSDLTREEFMKHAYEWKEKYGGIIYHQIEKLGCSVDWDRVSFTMDADYYKAVIKVFVDLYNKKMIYRGARMINWDPAAKTALSDEEVEYKEIQGKLYYVKYAVAAADGQPTAEFITIATQRPETIMGDSGVCVNPNDERFAHLKGKKVIVPLVNRAVPVIFDEYVDPAFGTGALKVTPAHDINDYNLGLKHNLPVIDTLNEDGTLNEAAQVFVGMDRFEARKKVVETLQEQGLLIKEEEYTTRIGLSQRSMAVVEPRISTQWFVNMKPLAEKALTAVTSGEVRIHPGDKFMATYKYWLENIKDWCISRQLWWGQRIPAWYDDNGNCYVAETEEEAVRQWSTNTNSINPPGKIDNPYTSHPLKQDVDVLDTWFSSWLWPIEVFKGVTHPGNPDINYYYPTSVLVTGQDIIFFWVARMIMAGMEFMEVKPFSDVYFTGMVRDKLGRKMSKQLGNSPDLLMLIDKFGADAVRFGIMISSPAGNDLLFDETSPEQGMRFNNKIWNALKLVKMFEARVSDTATTGSTSFAITWFENKLQAAKAELEQHYKDFKLSEGLKTLYSLIWDDFCSYYLEWIKPGMDQPMDKAVYEKTVSFFTELMLLLHPYMPFVTEEIYHLLAPRTEDLCVKQLTTALSFDPVILKEGQLLIDVITGLRDARIKNEIKIKEPIKLYIQSDNNELYKAIETILKKQVNIEQLSFVTEPVVQTITTVIDKDKFFIETERPVDTSQQKEQLLKDLEYYKKFLESVNKKLSNERFIQSARPDVVQLEQKKKTDAEEKIKILEESLSNL
ncbi:valine--tRNA ligase [Niastella yeongjuensis]|uniref:Valine--tRNA ligase n=1 Tax=Niastella yeongjuensis TaxID=354355 RepID=A0A1V9EHD5_9BACT|nr:valine--tRNA ligase [Niastella yeongjuensis]OQP45472.1 valine--tRNA ligase [Niastella yeongjuensis]SEP48325.1 valyl-tRNA synthetase [Niastella yeongjuensis]